MREWGGLGQGKGRGHRDSGARELLQAELVLLIHRIGKGIGRGEEKPKVGLGCLA